MTTKTLTPEARRTFWAEHGAKWRESGLSRTAYCRQAGVRSFQLTYWLKKEKPAHSQVAAPAGDFLKIQSTPSNPMVSSPGDYAFSVTLGDRVSLYWQGEARPGYIREPIQEFSQ